MSLRPSLAAALLLSTSACSGGTAPAPATPPGEPEVSRPPWTLLVERLSPDGARTFVSMGVDGTFVSPFPSVPTDAVRVDPSPDGRTLALLRPADGFVHLWLVDRDGLDARPVLVGPRTVESVAWSPDGRRLLVGGSTLDETLDVWVVNADGTGLVDLTPDPLPAVFYDRDPAWSPDGRRIAFTSNRSGTTRLWVMNADGTDPAQVISPAIVAAEHVPAWSPDGGLIAFVTEGGGGAGVGVVRPDGTGLRFFPAPLDARSPAWLPDGRLAFSDRRAGNYEIQALDPATGAVTNVSRHRDHDLRAGVLRHVPAPAWLGLGPATRYPIHQPGAQGLALADLDTDGFTDVAVLSPAVPEIQLLRGTGGGSLAPAGSLELGPDALEVAWAGVSLDPAPDLVVLRRDSFSVYRGGAAGPGVAVDVGLAGEGRGMALADLDRSGRDEVVVVVERPGSGAHFTVFTANGVDDLVFVVDLATEFGEAGRLCAGDVTGEGHPDVVALMGGASPSILLLRGRGDVTFEQPVVAATGVPVDRQTVPLCADLDGDGRTDLVLLQPGLDRGLSVLPWRGSSFGPATLLDVAGSSVAAADLDRDGDVDLLVASPARRSLLFLRNLGDGRFATPVEIPLGGVPSRLAVADVDGDTWPDVVVLESDGWVSVLRNLRRTT